MSLWPRILYLYLGSYSVRYSSSPRILILVLCYRFFFWFFSDSFPGLSVWINVYSVQHYSIYYSALHL